MLLECLDIHSRREFREKLLEDEGKVSGRLMQDLDHDKVRKSIE